MSTNKKTLRERYNEWTYRHIAWKYILEYSWTFLVCTASAFIFAIGFKTFMTPNNTGATGSAAMKLVSGGMDYSSIKGFIDYLPYGYAIWEEIQNYLNIRFKENGAENVYLPMVIPTSLFNKEKEHIEGFAPETLVATVGGGEKLADPLVIRPTSEILFSDLYKRLVSSYRDLPKMYNQWCSVVRWEKTTRPFLRGAEFLWQEGHCLFETRQEAEANVKTFLNIYDDCGRDLLAIPFLKGRKTVHETFAGALATYTVEALMHDGKALQSGTSHLLGQGFAQAFGIQFQGRNNALETPWQTSWGVSTRLIGAIIMAKDDSLFSPFVFFQIHSLSKNVGQFLCFLFMKVRTKTIFINKRSFYEQSRRQGC